jgi:hypothetical protein
MQPGSLCTPDMERVRSAILRLYQVALAKGLELDAEQGGQTESAVPTCREETTPSSDVFDQHAASQSHPRKYTAR